MTTQDAKSGLRQTSLFKRVYRSCKRGARILMQQGFAALKAHILGSDRYTEWLATYDTFTDREREAIRRYGSSLREQPVLSVIVVAAGAQCEALLVTVASMRAQLYGHWQLFISFPSTLDPAAASRLKEHTSNDPRIQLLERGDNVSFSAACAAATSASTGAFIVYLRPGDIAREHFLTLVAAEINNSTGATLIYGDDDALDNEGKRRSPHFKPNWDPELLLTIPYMGYGTFIRREVHEAIQGIKKNTASTAAWDLILRASEVVQGSTIRHIPHIVVSCNLSHTPWNGHLSVEAATAQSETISEHFTRTGQPAPTIQTHPSHPVLNVRRGLPARLPRVSLIVPTHNQRDLLEVCVTGLIERTEYRNSEVIIVDNRSDDAATLAFLQDISSHPRVRVIRDGDPFNFARINNRAAQIASGEILGFINNDIEVTTPSWLAEMVAAITPNDVAAVGARLLYPTGLIQHVGVTLGIGGVADHPFKLAPSSTGGHHHRILVPHTVSAVTAACMLVKKETFHHVGGFDEELFAVAYNDVDLCLRLTKAGHRVVVTPYAELIHHESISRGYEDTPEKKARFAREYGAMRERWGELLQYDPYYNPNLSLASHNWELAFPPRSRFPWR